MKLHICALIFCICTTVGAFAQSLSEQDRSVTVTFNPDKAINLRAVVNAPVLVELADGEDFIEPLVRGNSEDDGWEIVKRGNRLLIQAYPGAGPTSLTAMTKKRSYILDLVPVARTAKTFESRIARIVVVQPLPKAARPVPVKAESVPLVAPPLPIPKAFTEKRNREYSLQVVNETSNIRPIEVFDNGKFTFFRFAPSSEIPGIYRAETDSGEEWVVNLHKDGDYYVAQAVAPLWTLRLGKTVLGVFNDAAK